MIEDIGKITELYSHLSVGDEDRDDGESNSIVNRKNIRFIAINNGIDSKEQNTLEFAPLSTSCQSRMQEVSARK